MIRVWRSPDGQSIRVQFPGDYERETGSCPQREYADGCALGLRFDPVPDGWAELGGQRAADDHRDDFGNDPLDFRPTTPFQTHQLARLAGLERSLGELHAKVDRAAAAEVDARRLAAVTAERDGTRRAALRLAKGEPLTAVDVAADPEFWIAGAGREIASRTDCGHGYNLTDSCPGCDAEEEAGRLDVATLGGNR